MYRCRTILDASAITSFDDCTCMVTSPTLLVVLSAIIAAMMDVTKKKNIRDCNSPAPSIVIYVLRCTILTNFTYDSQTTHVAAGKYL